MRIVESRADHLRLHSSDTVRALFWAAVFLASAATLAWFFTTRRPDDTSGVLVGIGFCLVAAVVRVWQAETVRVDVNRFGPSRRSETFSLVRHRESQFDAQLIVGLRVSTDRRFAWFKSTARGAGPTFTPIVRSSLTAALSDGRSVELGWRRGLWSSDRKLQQDTEYIADVLQVPVHQ